MFSPSPYPSPIKRKEIKVSSMNKRFKKPVKLLVVFSLAQSSDDIIIVLDDADKTNPTLHLDLLESGSLAYRP